MGIDEAGIEESQLRSPLVHPLNKLRLVTRNMDSNRHCSEIA